MEYDRNSRYTVNYLFGTQHFKHFVLERWLGSLNYILRRNFLGPGFATEPLETSD